MHSPLAHLSGGMDSTSIALIAQDEMHTSNAIKPLHTLSLVYEDLPILARERPYIEEVLQQEQAIVPHRLLADNILDFDSFTNPPPHEEPYAGLWRLAMDKATVDVAASIDASTILTGLGADEIHDIHPYYLADLLRQGRILKAWFEACRWAQAYACGPWAMLHHFGFANIAPPWLIKYQAKSQFKQKFLPLNKHNDWTVPPWITPEFARHHALWDRMADQAHCISNFRQHTLLSLTLHAIENRPGCVLRWSVAAPLGMTIAHPFLDRRLLTFGLGMQQRLQPEPGKMKPVLAEAMRERLPAMILNRKRKGHFNEIYYLGFSRNLDSLVNMVKQAPSDIVGMFDRDVLLRTLHQANVIGANARQMQRLDYTLAIIKWLSKHQEWLRIPHTPSHIIRINSI